MTSSVPPPAGFLLQGDCALESELGIGKWEVLDVVGSAYLRPAWGSGMLLGGLEAPPAFLEAVPSAWTVTRGFALRRSEVPVTSSVPPPAAFYCRGICALERELGIGNWEV